MLEQYATQTSEFSFSFKYQTHLHKICTSSLLLLKILQLIICQEDISLERNSYEKTLYSPSDIGQYKMHAEKKKGKICSGTFTMFFLNSSNQLSIHGGWNNPCRWTDVIVKSKNGLYLQHPYS